MTSVRANGLELEYESVGESDAPVILLIMGLGAQLILWPDELCERLVAAGFRVVRFDNRDVGLSSKLDAQGRPNLLWQTVRAMLKLRVKAPYSLEDMAADTIGLLDALGIESAHVVGASMGGLIAQIMASKHPSRVRSLTAIMSTTGDPSLPRADRKVLKRLFSRPKGQDVESLVTHGVGVWQAIGSPGYVGNEGELRDAVRRQVTRSYHPAGFVRQMAAVMVTGSIAALADDIRTPALVLHGTADPLVPIAHGRDLARRIGGAKFKAIDGMGHDLPPAMLTEVSDLLSAHASAAEQAR